MATIHYNGDGKEREVKKEWILRHASEASFRELWQHEDHSGSIVITLSIDDIPYMEYRDIWPSFVEMMDYFNRPCLAHTAKYIHWNAKLNPGTINKVEENEN